MNEKAVQDNENKIYFGQDQEFREKVFCSKYLSERQRSGALKIGDVVIPGDGVQMPAFSKTGFINKIDRLLDFTPEADRKALLQLFSLAYFMPKFKINWLLKLAEKNAKFPDWIGAPLRMMNLGLRGIFFSLYYANLPDAANNNKKIFAALNYQTQCGDELDNESLKNFSWQNPSIDTIAAIAATAKSATHAITQLSIMQRLKHINALKKIILTKKEVIIDVLQSATKKTRSDALFSEIFGVLDHLDFLEKTAKKALADEKVKTPIALLGKKSHIEYAPFGTVLIISPWNYPFYQAIVPITSAFVAGNAVIYKPSEYTPMQGLIENLLRCAGFANDWVQVVYGDAKIGAALIDTRPDKIFFTGSLATGKKIMTQAAQQIIPVELELGGKDPMLVFDDVNLDRAVAGAAWGAFTNTGQSCTSVERLYVQSDIYTVFKQKLAEAARKIKQAVDDEKDQGNADIGLMTTAQQIAIVRDHLQDALSKGAIELTGHVWDQVSEKIPPLILENVNQDMQVLREETFGPIVVLIPFEGEADAVAMANDSQYGLSASVWTADKKRASRVTRALATGNVSVNNVMLTEGNHYLPFGGTKLSGIGRYKGIHGLRNFCQIKSVLIDANSSKIEANWYPYTQKKYALFSRLTDGLFSGSWRGLWQFIVNGLKLESYSKKAAKDEQRD